jgi:predicted enzyme related to lactoylglutathione lyase
MTTGKPIYGEICYIEIPAPNLEKAKRFYGTVFQWEVSDSDLGETAYAMFQAAGLDGGLDPRKEVVDKGVLLYLKVEEIPAKLKEIENAGSQVVANKTQVIEGSDDYGFMALFRDPNGNRLGLISKT